MLSLAMVSRIYLKTSTIRFRIQFDSCEYREWVHFHTYLQKIKEAEIDVSLHKIKFLSFLNCVPSLKSVILKEIQLTSLISDALHHCHQKSDVCL